MKKYKYISYLLLFILVFFIESNNVFAKLTYSFDYYTHDLTYDITSFKVSGDTITFKGWAFIDHLDNVGSSITNGNLQIAITASGKDANGNSITYTIIEDNYTSIDLTENRWAADVDIESYEKTKYNYAKGNNKYDLLCINGSGNGSSFKGRSSTYNGSVVYNGIGNSVSGGSTCLYYQVGFEIQFKVSDLAKYFATESDISFYIETRLKNAGSISGTNIAWPYENCTSSGSSSDGYCNGDGTHGTDVVQLSNDKNLTDKEKGYYWLQLGINVWENLCEDNSCVSSNNSSAYKVSFEGVGLSSNYTVTYNSPRPLSYTKNNGKTYTLGTSYSVGNVNKLTLSKIGYSSLKLYCESSNASGKNATASNSFVVSSKNTSSKTYTNYVTGATYKVSTYILEGSDPTNKDSYGGPVICPGTSSLVTVSSSWGHLSGSTKITIKLEETSESVSCQAAYGIASSTSNISKSISSGKSAEESNTTYEQCREGVAVSTSIYYGTGSTNICTIKVSTQLLIYEKGELNIGYLTIPKTSTTGSDTKLGMAKIKAGLAFGLSTTTYSDTFGWSFGLVSSSDHVTGYIEYNTSNCGNSFSLSSAGSKFKIEGSNNYNLSYSDAAYQAIANYVYDNIYNGYKNDSSQTYFNEFVKSYDSNVSPSKLDDSSLDDYSFGSWTSTTSTNAYNTITSTKHKTYSLSNNKINTGYTKSGSMALYEVTYNYKIKTAYENRYTAEITYGGSKKTTGCSSSDSECYINVGAYKYIPIDFPSTKEYYPTINECTNGSETCSNSIVSKIDAFKVKFDKSINLSLAGFTWNFEGYLYVGVDDGVYTTETCTTNCDDDDGGSPLSWTYRSISVTNPFPKSVYGTNWKTWYNSQTNKSRLSKTYDKAPIYTIKIDSSTMSKIKKISSFYSVWTGSNDTGIVGDTGSGNFVKEYATSNASKSYCPLGAWSSDCDAY